MWRIVSQVDGRYYPVTAQGLSIGREGCTIPIPVDDRLASRRHAIVRLRGNDIEVEDCDSKNGTFLGSLRVTHPTVWRAGVTLHCGETAFELLKDAERAPSNTPAAAAPATPPPLPAELAEYEALLAQSDNPPTSPPPRPVVESRIPVIRSSSSEREHNSTMSMVVIGMMMMVVGLVWWHYFRIELDTLDSTLEQSVATLGERDIAQNTQRIILLYSGSIILACIGAVMFFGSIVHLRFGGAWRKW